MDRLDLRRRFHCLLVFFCSVAFGLRPWEVDLVEKGFGHGGDFFFTAASYESLLGFPNRLGCRRAVWPSVLSAHCGRAITAIFFVGPGLSTNQKKMVDRLDFSRNERFRSHCQPRRQQGRLGSARGLRTSCCSFFFRTSLKPDTASATS